MFIERRNKWVVIGLESYKGRLKKNLAKVILCILTFLRTEIISRVRKEGKGD